jgi:hypothetical protein
MVVVVVAMCAVPLVVYAQAGDPPDLTPGISEDEIPEAVDFLWFLASPVGAIVVGIVVSMRLERWSWYQAQNDELKRVLAYGITLAVATGAYALARWVPATFWEAAAPFWMIVVVCFFAVFGNQGWFQLVIKRARHEETVRSFKVLG